MCPFFQLSNLMDENKKCEIFLTAANGTSILTFGFVNLNIDLGSGQIFHFHSF